MPNTPITKGQRVHSSGGKRIIVPVKETRAEHVHTGARIYYGNQYWTVTNTTSRNSLKFFQLLSAHGKLKELARLPGEILPVVPGE